MFSIHRTLLVPLPKKTPETLLVTSLLLRRLKPHMHLVTSSEAD